MVKNTLHILNKVGGWVKGATKEKDENFHTAWVNYVVIVFLQNQGYPGQSGEKDASG